MSRRLLSGLLSGLLSVNQFSLLALFSLAGALPCPAWAKAPDAAQVKEILQRIDQTRQPSGGSELQVVLTSEQDGREVDSDDYLIRSDGTGNALLTMQNREKRGQKILNTREGIWIYFPKTRRPLRLTAVQQLHGQASVGDVLRTRWSEEYKVAAIGNSAETIDGRPCYRITLEAAMEDATYRKIELYLSENKFDAVKADMYSFGGKLIKTAHYGESTRIGQYQLISSTRIVSALDAKGGKQTLYSIKAVKPVKVKSEDFSLHALEVGQ